ncbi:uncharacterized protein ColSpa_02224 [Colletotrichum spaethianum]|uniref:Uncharacterized protein n=1 Tax=Colletotrichum spaethianum TaxID=700344 RepID=A0AA37L529_9PEZI|nr:uncharacterized protein ColSpa_02224 [Colletotrichum spaethianum]GKT42043.1 hypothetical protein ColSpa_02224 [Colletotrichum spaethianum]
MNFIKKSLCSNEFGGNGADPTDGITVRIRHVLDADKEAPVAGGSLVAWNGLKMRGPKEQFMGG